jgi:hypothetical protein
VWGRLVEEWLHALLPANAADVCRGSVRIVVTQLPSCRQVGIDDFADKADLIDVALASAHVPLALDGRLSRVCRGVHCVDGSFPDFFTNDNCDILKAGGDAVVFDYFDDPLLQRTGRLDMLATKGPDEVRALMRAGYAYAQRLSDEGVFARYDDGGAARK